MTLVWTRSRLPFSKLIQWATQSKVSHFSILFQNTGGKGLIFQSNLLGVHLVYAGTFFKHADICYEEEIKMSYEDECKLFDLIVDKYDGRNYDFGAALYMLLKGCLRNWFGWYLYGRNPWGKDSAFECHELYATLGLEMPKEELAIMSPYDLYLFRQGLNNRGKHGF